MKTVYQSKRKKQKRVSGEIFYIWGNQVLLTIGFPVDLTIGFPVDLTIGFPVDLTIVKSVSRWI